MTTLKQNNDITEGFIKFIIVQVYRDNFLSSLPRILTLAYESGILLRYAFLLFLLSIYSLFPYIFIFIGSYAIPFIDILGFQLFSYRNIDNFFGTDNFFGFDIQNFYLLRYFVCLFIFVLIRYYLPYCNLMGMAIIAVVTSYSIFHQIIIFESSGNILPLIITTSSYFIIIYVIPILNDVFKFLHFIVICHITSIVAPFIAFYTLLEKRLLEKVQIDNVVIIAAVMSGIFLARHFQGLIYSHFFYVVISFYVLTFSLLYSKTKIFLIAIGLFCGCFIFSFPLNYLRYKEGLYVSLTREEWNNIVYFMRLGFTIGGGIILLYLLQSLPQFLFPYWWFARKYRYLFGKNIQTIFKAFTVEFISEGRESIARFVLSSPSLLIQKIETLKKMEAYEKKTKNPSQDVLDELAKAHQALRKEQRQAKFDISPSAQDSLPNVTGFDFTDPTTENKHPATLSPIDSARQQLLNWLKGKTPAKPSIDKLLIYQWKEYEIGIGLKYSGQMGGDFYDLFQLPTANADNQVGVFISDFGLLVGDLTGHGVETALNLSKTHNFWVETDLSQDVLTTMQAFDKNFKTTFHPFPKYEGCCLCYLQLKEKEITLCNAGLLKPILIKTDGSITELKEQFFAISKNSFHPKISSRVELNVGEMLVVYSDGFFENENQDGKQFGQDHFKQLLLQHQHRDMNTLIDTMFSTVYEYCQPEPIDDDETLLVIRRISTAD
jgi:serine phosphatase RsbU (regulator of sigma subunit)